MQEYIDKSVQYKPAQSEQSFSALVKSIDDQGNADLIVFMPDGAVALQAVPKSEETDDGTFATWLPEA